VWSQNQKQFKKGTLESVRYDLPRFAMNMSTLEAGRSCFANGARALSREWCSGVVLVLLVLSHNDKQFEKGRPQCVSLYLPLSFLEMLVSCERRF
jgi:hypothetical protein